MLFGGTFDPPTLAHLAAAEAFHQVFNCSVEWVPNGQSPLKSHAHAGQHRLAMLDLMLEQDPRFSVNRIELDQVGPSYTVETLSSIRAHTDEPLVWCIGADSFSSIQRWEQWPRLLELAHLAVVERPGSALAPPAAWAENKAQPSELAHHSNGLWCQVPFEQQDIASSVVRQAIQTQQSWRHLVDHDVANYIWEQKLYVDDDG